MIPQSSEQVLANWRLQPLVAANSGHMMGFEVLTAFRSPQLAEQYFQQASMATLIQVFLQQLAWVREQGLSQYLYFCNLPVSVLIQPSCRQLLSDVDQQRRQGSMVVELQDPESLSLLNESEQRQLVTNLRRFRRQSVPLWLDDVTPSLLPVIAPLSEFFDGIKIDKGAFWLLARHPNRLKTFVLQCKALCPHVLIEGIETHHQYQQAMRAGADYLQGYLWPETRVYRPRISAIARPGVTRAFVTKEKENGNDASVV